MKFVLLVLILTLFTSLPVLGKETKIKFATVAPAGTPWADLIEQIKKDVNKDSKGRLQIKAYLGGQLGGEQELIQKIRRGNVQGGGFSSAALATVVPEIDVLELPYLFESLDEADYIMDNKLLTPFKELFAKNGLILITWSENGLRSIGHKSKAILTPDDLVGEKMRSQESDVHLGFWKKVGAAPQAMSVTQVLGNLQTGVVSGFDNTPLFTLAAEWHTAIKHYTLTKHIYQPGAIVYGKKFWDEMTATDQKILLGKGNGFAPESRVAIRAMDAELVSSLKEQGVAIHELSKDQVQKFKDKLKGLHDELVKKIGGDAKKIYDLIVEGKKEFASK